MIIYLSNLAESNGWQAGRERPSCSLSQGDASRFRQNPAERIKRASAGAQLLKLSVERLALARCSREHRRGGGFAGEF
jgi:hypothetical protein